MKRRITHRTLDALFETAMERAGKYTSATVPREPYNDNGTPLSLPTHPYCVLRFSSGEGWYILAYSAGEQAEVRGYVGFGVSSPATAAEMHAFLTGVCWGAPKER